ncbi:MAG TPA: matrixin family metalloprotease [Polyangiaceae bacterium]
MNAFKRSWPALLLLAGLFSTRHASAFCQATSCDPSKVDCKPSSAGCFSVGYPLLWASNCVSVSVQADASVSQHIDYDAAQASVTRAFDAWNNVTCTGGAPSISVLVKGPINCDASEYNEHRANANIVVFRDPWPYVGGEDALGMTRVRFNPNTGDIYDADIEVNAVTEPLSVGDAQPNAVDLDSLLTHEAGHLLGLGHSRDSAATMYPGYQLGSVELRTLSADDIAGLCGIYPPKRQPGSTSCEPRHGYSDLCGADQPEIAPTPDKPEPVASKCSFSPGRTSSVGVFVLGALLAFGLRRRRRFVAASLTTAALAGCSLDTRQLEYAQASAGQAGESVLPPPDSGSDTPEGDASPQPDAGGPPMIGGCLDLDEDGVADCDETLIRNATFKTDIEAWQADADAQLAWGERNAASDLPSGSALLHAVGTAVPGATGAALQSASQCLKVDGKQLVTVYANAFVDADQSSLGVAEIRVLFFDSEACAGAYVSSFLTPQPLSVENAEWFALKAGSVSGPDTKSALVRLVVSRPLEAGSFQASFDNVLLKVRAVE